MAGSQPDDDEARFAPPPEPETLRRAPWIGDGVKAVEAWEETQATAAKRLGLTQPRMNDLLSVLLTVLLLGLLIDITAQRVAERALRQTENLGEEIVSPLSKFHVWERSAALVWDAPWTGIGRGAFELAYPRVADVGGILRYQWMEDGYLQTVVDFGVPVGPLRMTTFSSPPRSWM